MASNSKAIASTALLLSLNLLFLTMVSSLSPAPAPAPAISAPLPPTPTPRPPTPTGGNPTPNAPPQAYCPINALKLGVCANLLGGLVNVTIGSPPTAPCCSLIDGLIDIEAAVCLCTAIRANVLGINLNKIGVVLSLILNKCGRQNSSGFRCPP